MKTSVRTLLQRKGTSVITISPDATVYDCIQTMVDHNVGSILVVEADDLVGIFTERDYLRRIVLMNRTSRETTVREAMTSEVMVATLDTTVEECLALMTEARCRHLPVVHNSRIKGLVSIGDCVKDLLRNAKAEVNSLQNYVMGRYPA